MEGGDPPGGGIPELFEVIRPHSLQPLAPPVEAEVGADPRAVGKLPHRRRAVLEGDAALDPQARLARVGREDAPLLLGAGEPDQVAGLLGHQLADRRAPREVGADLGQQHHHDDQRDERLHDW